MERRHWVGAQRLLGCQQYRTLYGGGATWDLAGKAGYAAAMAEAEPGGAVSQEAVPAPLVPDSTGEQAESVPAESVPAKSATELP